MAYRGNGDGFSAKRMKNDEGNSVPLHNDSEDFDENRKYSPSPVVHVRGLMDPVSDIDIKEAVRDFGNINFLMNFPNRKMALIEFESIESAKELVSYAQQNEILVGGRPAKFNFSVSQSIKRPASTMDARANNVLLLTIMNPRHVITVDVIHAICNPIGNVLRIVIFRKNGVQSMVEFDSVESAVKAKNSLHGADIYANSCTIRAEFAKPTTLTVNRNDQDTWDFTAPLRGREPSGPPPRNQPLLADPGQSIMPKSYSQMPILPGGRMSDMNSYGAGPRMGGYDYEPMMMGGGAMPSVQQNHPECVLMVYGLNMERMNCQRIFNLFCLYGNIVKIRFLKSKEGSAMVQMSNKDGCEQVIHMLSGCSFFGQKVIISYSKQAYVTEVNAPYALGDGTLSYQDFTTSKNNRFSTPASAMKNRISPPQSCLYFFNAPPGIDEDTLYKAFTDVDVTPPSSFTMLRPKSEASSRGFLNFEDSVNSCTEALICANNTKLPNPNGVAPYILKLAFSPSQANN